MNLVIFLKEKLEFKNIVDNKNLVSEVTFNYINNNFSDNEIKEFKVAEINPLYMDGIKLFEYYDIDYLGVNCLICECKRGTNKEYVALLVPTGYKYNMSSTVRKHTNSRMVSVAPLEYVLEKTKMEYGSINPIGLPKEWKIFIDPMILNSDIIICGSGLQKSKICFPSKYLLKINNIEVLEGLARKD